MDELWPQPRTGIDVGATVFAEDRPASTDTPWVAMLMISSLDGAAALDGVSGGLGGPADKAIFGAMRSIADAIVVGGGTAHAENYGPVPERQGAAAERRVTAGQPLRPRLAVLSRSLPFAPDHRLFSESTAPPLIYTVEGDPDQVDRQHALGDRAEIVTVPGNEVAPTAVVDDLARRGHRVILLEGGPRLNESFLAAGLVDEIHLSLAPVAIGGAAPRIIQGVTDESMAASPGDAAWPLTLQRIWMGDDLLFLRYTRAAPT